MGEAPWVSHRGWTAEKVGDLIARNCPELAELPVAYLDEGFDFQVFTVGEWAFKFPKRDDYATALKAEKALLDLVGPDCPIPIPRYEVLAETAEGDLFAGYRLLPGTPGIDAEPRMVLPEGSSAAIAQFLTHVHGIEATSPQVAAMPPPESEDDGDWRESLERYCRTVEPNLPNDLVRGCRILMADDKLTPHGYDGPAVFCHRDLAPDHILIDPATRRVVGVIDWSDSGIGDPAADFAGVLAWQGMDFAEDVLRRCGRSYDRRLLRRAQAHAFGWIMGSLEYGLLADRPRHLAVCGACLRRFLAEVE